MESKRNRPPGPAANTCTVCGASSAAERLWMDNGGPLCSRCAAIRRIEIIHRNEHAIRRVLLRPGRYDSKEASL